MLVVNLLPFRKDEADLTNQAANVHIFLCLLVALALKTNAPPDGTLGALMFDMLLSLMTFAVMARWCGCGPSRKIVGATCLSVCCASRTGASKEHSTALNRAAARSLRRSLP